ncbi:MAG TPA: SPOR domain-containing protein [Rhizobiaceae bacterium]|nr:SPOR domain-containing protein [Rhizobiaceae bacterium]
MADSNQLKRVDPVDLGDEDPFAELTRIMGFDPRVPVHPASERQATPVVAMPAVAAPEPDLDLSSDELSIDLEKELLGDLSFEEQASAPDEVAPRAVALPAAIDEGGEVDPHLEAAIAADLYDEFAPEVMEEGFERGPLLSDVDFDAAFERDLAHRDDRSHSAVEDEQSALQDRLSVEDAALLAALDPASVLNGPGNQDEQRLGSAQPSLAAELDPDVDLAMAEVDMDFGLDAELAEPRFHDVEQGGDAHYAPDYEMQAVEPAPYEEGSIDFDDFDEVALEQAPLAEAEPVSQAAYPEQESSQELEPQVSGHDDWQASGRDEWRAAEYSEPQSVQYDEWQSEEGFAREAVATDELAADMADSVSAVAPEMEQEELSLEDELNALLGNTVPRAKLTGGYDGPPLSALAEPVAPTDSHGEHRSDLAGWGSAAAPSSLSQEARAAAQPYPHNAAEEISDDYAGPSYQVAEVEHAQEWGGASSYAEQSVELEFDDAFDAAFENSLLAGEVEVNTHRYAGFQSPGSEHFAADEAEAESAYAGSGQAHAWHATALAAADDDVPEIETIDVPETAIAVADDLDIPEVTYEEDARPAPVLDEFESEFAAVFAEPQQPEATAAHHDDHDRHAAQTQPVEGSGYDYSAGFAAAAVAAGAAYGATARAQADRDFDPAQGFNADELPGSRKPVGRDADPFDAVDYDDADEEVALPPYVQTRRAPQRRGLMVAAIVGGVAVLGGVGAFALSSGSGAGDAPAIVKADDSPIKVRPENPGGTTVPNQDSKVYQTVAGGGNAPAPAQEKLISSAEEPVDMAAEASEPQAMPSGIDDGEASDDGGDEIAAIAKAEDRIEPDTAAGEPGTDNTEVAAVTPRRVRTMVVRPDGTLVPREDPAPAAAAEPQAAAEAIMEAQPAASSAEANASAQQASAGAANPAAQSSGLKPANVPARVNSGTPATVPVAPSRPADQPVNVVGEVKPAQVASISTTSASAGGWAMQIASQPSEDAAKSTFQDLARRYSGVLGGRDATIVKAEIAGKGTFWRVRVPAGSRNDAISLCESYKAAGGSCFVSK